MQPPWTAEHVVSPELALQLIRRCCPKVQASRIAPFGSGWDNTAFLVDDAIVFRFPRRSLAAELIENEARILPRIAASLPLPIPVPAWVGRDEATFPWTFVGYRKLVGTTACGSRLTRDERAAMARALGEFLRVLHGIDGTVLDAPPDLIFRADMRRRMPDLRERLLLLEREGVLRSADPWLSWTEQEPPDPASALCLCHGDLYARHLLVDENRALCGVIDWGDVHIGDAGVDAAIAYSFLPAGAREAFEDAYGPLDDRTRRLARLRALVSAVAITWFGHATGDLDLLEEGRTALALVLE